MNEFQAAMGICNLKHIKEEIESVKEEVKEEEEDKKSEEKPKKKKKLRVQRTKAPPELLKQKNKHKGGGLCFCCIPTKNK